MNSIPCKHCKRVNARLRFPVICDLHFPTGMWCEGLVPCWQRRYEPVDAKTVPAVAHPATVETAPTVEPVNTEPVEGVKEDKKHTEVNDEPRHRGRPAHRK